MMFNKHTHKFYTITLTLGDQMFMHYIFVCSHILICKPGLCLSRTMQIMVNESGNGPFFLNSRISL